MKLIVTLALLFLFIFGIKRNVPANTLLLLLSLLGLGVHLIMGTDLMGGAGSGSAVIDAFEFMMNSMIENIAGMGLTCVLMAAYCDVMVRMKTTDTLAALLSRPLKGIKSKVLILAAMAVITSLLKIAITVSPALTLILMTVFIPIMKSKGISPEAGIPFIIIANAATWSPASVGLIASAPMIGYPDVNMALWFSQMMLPMGAVFTAAAILFLIINYLFFAKPEQYTGEAEPVQMEFDASNPTIYAILPLLPIILLIVFSPLVVSNITISIPATVLLSLLVAVLFDVIRTRRWKVVPELLGAFFSAMGEQLKSMGLLIAFAMSFATILNLFDGMQIIAALFEKLRMPNILLVLLLSIFAALLNFSLGSYFGSIAIAVPLAGKIAEATGINPLFMCLMINTACSIGSMSSPVCPTHIISQNMYHMSEGRFIKSLALPTWGSIIATAMIGALLFS